MAWRCRSQYALHKFIDADAEGGWQVDNIESLHCPGQQPRHLLPHGVRTAVASTTPHALARSASSSQNL
uniref:Uncharacterized protein n=1 Tax=Oryza sativa subsp. japonica TaxID=39947 RepID=Q6ZF87_ORYSJ|nr:hypothetical protein [Oryza sativa Japonica Group]